MDLIETRKKLEFETIISSIKKFSSSALGLSLLEEIPFYTVRVILQEELEKVNQMREYVGVEGELELTKLKDIKPVLEQTKIKGLFITPEKFLWILDFLIISRLLKSKFSARGQEFKDRYKKIVTITEDLFADKILEHNINITVDENGEVKDSASSNLKKIRNEIRSKSELLRKKLFKILKDFSDNDFVRDDIVTLRDGRTVIPIKVENKRKIKGIIHSSSGSGATIFVEPEESIELNNELTELQFEEKREIEKILIALTNQVAGFYNEFSLNYIILSELDFLQSKAKYSLKINGVMPLLNDEYLLLINAYHPILLDSLDKKNVIAMNLSIGKEFNTLIVTGPNAGGKTVALKTVGLLQMMFQSGILIPCDDNSSLKLFDKIFVNIGDEQSIQNNLSTFSSHLKAIKEVLDNSDGNSLVLIDEICAGTDPAFGSALSCAILKELSERSCITLVTTHIGALKLFAYNTEDIENASLEFNYETLSPNFNFITGVPGQSFTFEIARKYNFPEKILHFSESLLGDNENNIEKAIKELNENKQKYEILKNEFSLQNSRLKGLIKMYDDQIKEHKNKEKSLIADAKKEAENLLKNANKVIENTIKEIRENKDLKPKVIKETFKKEAEKILDIIPEEEDINKNQNFASGNIVIIKGSTATGQIIEIKDKTAIINFNGITIKSKLSELEIVKENIRGDNKRYDAPRMVDNNEYNPELDLRGKYTEDIKDMIDVFLNNANINSMKEVRIIHGKGTGKLREAVNHYLKNNKLVKSYRLGNWNEGDSGVTIVEL